MEQTCPQNKFLVNILKAPNFVHNEQYFYPADTHIFLCADYTYIITFKIDIKMFIIQII